MLKQIFEFLGTGLAVIFTYTIYFISMVILTLLLGLPIGIGIKMIADVIDIFFVNTGVLPT